MPSNRTGAAAIQDVFYWTFYWIGIAMAGVCVVMVLAGNTESFWRFEHAHIPLSWMAGGVAMLAFALAEYWDSTPGIESATELSEGARHREILHQESV